MCCITYVSCCYEESNFRKARFILGHWSQFKGPVRHGRKAWKHKREAEGLIALQFGTGNNEWRYSAHLLFLQFKTPSYGMVQSTVRVSLPAPVD